MAYNSGLDVDGGWYVSKFDIQSIFNMAKYNLNDRYLGRCVEGALT